MRTRVVLVGKPGCHLCDDARPTVAAVAAEAGVGWDEVSILDDPELAARYRDMIPVVLVDGAPVSRWWVDADELRSVLAAPPVAGQA